MASVLTFVISSCMVLIANGVTPDIGGCNYLLLTYADTNIDITAAAPTDYCANYDLTTYSYSDIYMCDSSNTSRLIYRRYDANITDCDNSNPDKYTDTITLFLFKASK